MASNKRKTVSKQIEELRRVLSPTTVSGWSSYLRVLEEQFGSRQLRTVTRTELEAVAMKIKADALRRAVNRNGDGAKEGFISCARAVWNRAVEDGFADDNPAANIKKPARRSARKRRGLKPQEIEEIWDVLSSRSPDPELAIIVFRLALETGARRQEMLELRRSGLHQPANIVQYSVGAKAGSVRRQPITEELMRALQGLVRARSPLPKQPKDTHHLRDPKVLLDSKGQPITRGWFERHAALVRREIPSLSTEGDIWFTWHLCRHTAARMVERAGGFSVALTFLGHAQPKNNTGTTILYTEADLDEVRSVLARIWSQPFEKAF